MVDLSLRYSRHRKIFLSPHSQERAFTRGYKPHSWSIVFLHGVQSINSSSIAASLTILIKGMRVRIATYIDLSTPSIRQDQSQLLLLLSKCIMEKTVVSLSIVPQKGIRSICRGCCSLSAIAGQGKQYQSFAKWYQFPLIVLLSNLFSIIVVLLI